MQSLRSFCCLITAGALCAADVTSFTLIDADANVPIAGYDPIANGATLNLSALPTTHLNIRSNVNGAVGSVKMQWSGAESGSQTESVAPYAMKGDSDGNYTAWTPSVGSYQLTGTPYQSSGASGGVAGAIATLAFTVSTGAVTPPPSGGSDGSGAITIQGELKRWHAVTLTMAGPWGSESSVPNPFLDYRMEVTFSNGALSYIVPGYFAADGNAGETSATSGTTWRAHLSPDLTGTWTYRVSFRQGTDVAVNGGGTTKAPYDGKTGSFTISETNKTGNDFRGKGRLAYVGQRYLKHLGSGEWFLKAGPDSPENLLAYSDFDGTSHHSSGTLKTWSPHVADWRSGDPTWKNGKGKGLIGALNYLASEGCNVFSFLTYNAGGDGKDVWPFVAHTDRLHYDCSKLDQWNTVFTHADQLGMYLHFKTQETENDNGTWGLDGGDLGRERKLYYRELIARFGHHLALNWNLGEENTQSEAQRKAMAQYFASMDPYHHLVVLHTYPGQQESVYRPLLGSASHLTGVSIQIDQGSVHQEVLQWINESQAAGKNWVVANDEQGSANTGIPADSATTGVTQDTTRRNVLWGALMAGGDGIESYFGYGTGETDLTLQNFRSRDRWWDYCRFALAFFRANLPYHDMLNRDDLVGNASNANSVYCFAKPGDIYAVYALNGGAPTLNLSGVSGNFAVRWYNPRSGGALQIGSITSIAGGAQRSLGTAPSDTGNDWAILVTRSGGTTPVNAAPSVNAGADRTITLPSSSSLDGTITDDGLPAGSSLTTTWSKVSGPGTVTFAAANAVDTSASFSVAGTYVLRLTANDGALSANDTVTVTVMSAPTAATITYQLIDSVTDTVVAASIADNATIDIGTLNGHGFSISALPSMAAASLRFTWSGPASGSRVENVAPYAIAGDTNGNFNAWTIPLGTYQISTIAYAATGGNGAVLATVTRTITVSDPQPALPQGVSAIENAFMDEVHWLASPSADISGNHP